MFIRQKKAEWGIGVAFLVCTVKQCRLMGLIFDVSHFELEIHETASSLIFEFD